jgi:hypothetical protein
LEKFNNVMHTNPLKPNARYNRTGPLSIEISFKVPLKLTPLDELSRRPIPQYAPKAKRYEVEDHRLRVDEEEASDVRQFLDLACLTFGFVTANTLQWRRFLHFLLANDKLPIAENAGALLLRQEENISAENKNQRIAFTNESDSRCTEVVRLYAFNITDLTAELQFEFVWRGGDIETMSRAIRMLHALVIEVEMGAQPVKVRFDGGPPQELAAVTHWANLASVIKVETTPT